MLFNNVEDTVLRWIFMYFYTNVSCALRCGAIIATVALSLLSLLSPSYSAVMEQIQFFSEWIDTQKATHA